MKLAQLRIFCTVVEEGSVSNAARKLHCVPSNVTTRLQELEDRVGKQLFDREKNRLSVTPEGRLFYREAQAILAMVTRTKSLFIDKACRGVLK